MSEEKNIHCPRIEASCPHQIANANPTKTCFIIMAYEERFSEEIENILSNAIKKSLNFNPVLAKGLKKGGSTDIFCTRVCKPIIESLYCILDCTYKNTNIGIEYATAQKFGKPVIITKYKPKKIIKLTGEEEKILEKLKKKGAIQYSKIPLDVPTDISGIFYIEYSGEEELNKKLLEAIEVKN